MSSPAYPSNDVESKGWFPVTPETIENFSATAYFFGRDLQAGLEGIPIGLI
ncbi:MAG: sialate O-acetylesterase, partial [Candidatus Marinimicrobia bacterium]|nr:sialate O-acetylesterase [Candidatus Neomarinimicrobiota bacterium]